MADPVLTAAQRLAEKLPALSAEIEKARRIPPAVVEALTDGALLRMSVPKSVGGPQVDPLTQAIAIETLARADASTAWCTMIASSTGLVGAYLEPATLKEIYGDPRAASCGVYAPKGFAQEVPGGFKLTGQWAFGSGCEHSSWRMGGAILLGEDGPKLGRNGMPDFRLMLFPAKDSKVVDTWDVSGMRGTGSHDLVVEELFVPAHHTFSPITDQPKETGPLYRFPLFGFLAAQVAAVGLGIARGALDEFKKLAVDKTPLGAKRSIANRGVVQLQVAQAEAKVRSARALLFGTLETMFEAAERGESFDVPTKAGLRLAATHAVTSSAEAVDLVYGLGGASSIYSASPLQRQFRDIHVVTQHAMVAPTIHELVGRALLGLEVEGAQL